MTTTIGADRWQDVRAMTDVGRVAVGPQLSYALMERPDRLVFLYARYWAAAKLIGTARSVLEVGCSEGSGAGLLAAGRDTYLGVDTDAEAIRIANGMHGVGQTGPSTLIDTASSPSIRFQAVDVEALACPAFDAAVSLDVIEHIPQAQEEAFVSSIAQRLSRGGVFVCGTPSATFDHLASPPSRLGHINTFTPDRLEHLMMRHFRLVISAGMQDTAIHFGHPEARHYLLAMGVGPR